MRRPTLGQVRCQAQDVSGVDIQCCDINNRSSMPKLLFYTGAGMSSESGLPTFRGEDGLWDMLDVEAVADRMSWYCGRRSDCNELK